MKIDFNNTAIELLNGWIDGNREHVLDVLENEVL